MACGADGPVSFLRVRKRFLCNEAALVGGLVIIVR
jgi:hypothetical protein